MRHSGLPLATSGSRANNTPCQTPLCPKRRPPRPQQPIFGMFRRSGLRFGHNIPRSRSPRRGKWRYENTDTPKERSSCCKAPTSLVWEHSEHHNENSTFSQHVLSVLIVGCPLRACTTTRTQRRRRRCTSGTSDITRRTRRLTEHPRCDSAPASSKIRGRGRVVGCA